MTTKSLLILILSAYNILLGVAFDYYLRVSPNEFTSYYGHGSSVAHGSSVEYLCLLSIAIYLTINIISENRPFKPSSSVTIHARQLEFASVIYYPSLLAIIFCSLFILKTEQALLGKNFDIQELVRYPFLEYSGILVLFAIGAAKKNKSKELAAYGAAFILVLVCLATSYRMSAIVIGLSIVFSRYIGKEIKKSNLALIGIPIYISLMAIGYFRQGVTDITFSLLLGYVNGKLDNTFTGVIETALIYTSVSQQQDLTQNLIHLIGVIAPLPSSLLPDSTSYASNIYNTYRAKVPGGGLLAGFFIYFNYLLAIPVLSFLYFAIRNSTKSTACSIMFFICFTCVSRWWLYGPYVLFKFSGIFAFIYLLNAIALGYEKNLEKIKKTPFSQQKNSRPYSCSSR